MKWHMRLKRLCATLSAFCLGFFLCSPAFAIDKSTGSEYINDHSIGGYVQFGWKEYPTLGDSRISEVKPIPCSTTNDKNTDAFQKIDITKFSFSESVLSGLKLVGGIFSNIWNTLDDVSIIYIFPLTLGIALVVIGRIERSGGKGKKKKGGDS